MGRGTNDNGSHVDFEGITLLFELRAVGVGVLGDGERDGICVDVVDAFVRVRSVLEKRLLSGGVELLEVDGTEGFGVSDVLLDKGILLEAEVEIVAFLSAADSVFWCIEEDGCAGAAVAQPWSFGNRC